ncbi:hypothetical protein D3C77_463280 [compost metagenome]
MYMREPSNRVITEPWLVKPRADNAVLPLPGVPTEVMPGERVTASCTVVLLRPSMASVPRLLVLAGVSMALRFRREPAGRGVARLIGSLSLVLVMAVEGRARAEGLCSSAKAGRESARQGARALAARE